MTPAPDHHSPSGAGSAGVDRRRLLTGSLAATAALALPAAGAAPAFARSGRAGRPLGCAGR